MKKWLEAQIVLVRLLDMMCWVPGRSIGKTCCSLEQASSAFPPLRKASAAVAAFLPAMQPFQREPFGSLVLSR